MTLEEAQKQVDSWIKEYGVRYVSELTNRAILTEEVGELARVMARKYGDQSFKKGEKDNLDDEMADVDVYKRQAEHVSALKRELDKISDRKEEIVEAAEILIKYEGYICLLYTSVIGR